LEASMRAGVRHKAVASKQVSTITIFRRARMFPFRRN
jgi:hypothetical protein